MLKKKFIIPNKYGLHIRAVTQLINRTTRYASKIEIVLDEKRINAKSVLGVMGLGAKQHDEIEFIIDGEDELIALSDLEKLVLNRFGDPE